MLSLQDSNECTLVDVSYDRVLEVKEYLPLPAMSTKHYR